MRGVDQCESDRQFRITMLTYSTLTMCCPVVLKSHLPLCVMPSSPPDGGSAGCCQKFVVCHIHRSRGSGFFRTSSAFVKLTDVMSECGTTAKTKHEDRTVDSAATGHTSNIGSTASTKSGTRGAQSLPNFANSYPGPQRSVMAASVRFGGFRLIFFLRGIPSHPLHAAPSGGVERQHLARARVDRQTVAAISQAPDSTALVKWPDSQVTWYWLERAFVRERMRALPTIHELQVPPALAHRQLERDEPALAPLASDGGALDASPGVPWNSPRAIVCRSHQRVSA
ncbi:hypothetical protein QBC46DRAFT_404090 [Diplogelasinospora grovesii]|uniref:Uncharacterized protein n=1 Tax=Diplogelasinospora grovesii TaxID=303347 RepID=A0AAN6NJQ1_9PEZI|nr:hypothetical protein QBC46DRAFT_404090 [Diplogelasinospora grovesii]